MDCDHRCAVGIIPLILWVINYGGFLDDTKFILRLLFGVSLAGASGYGVWLIALDEYYEEKWRALLFRGIFAGVVLLVALLILIPSMMHGTVSFNRVLLTVHIGLSFATMVANIFNKW